MTRLARSTTAASSSFLRWLRSSWNSRRLRCSSRSWSTSSRWRRVRSASASVGASLSSLSAGRLQAARQVVEFLLALAELGLELGLRCLGGHGVAQHAVAVDVADLQFLRLSSRRRSRAAAPRRAAISRVEVHSSEGGPDLKLKSLDSIVRLLADRRAVAELQRTHRRDPADGRRRPTRAGCRALIFSFSPQTLPAST